MTTPPTDDTRTGPPRGLGIRLFAVGVVGLLAAAAAGAAASPAPVPIDGQRVVERAETDESPRSGDEHHFDRADAPPAETPAVVVPAGLNDIAPRSPWAGIWGPEIEPLAAYEPQRRCVPGARPAVVAFAGLLRQAFPVGRSLGITRDCEVGRRSEHKEGRAYDWGVRVTDPAGREAASQFLAWLLATDEHGNEFAMARRLGVMYVIWDDHIWSSTDARAGWRPYTGENPHTDHVHVSFDWAGAAGRTSFWDAEGLRIGPELFGGFSLEDLPSSFDLGRDRYRRELGADPGAEVAWREPSAASEPAGTQPAEPDGPTAGPDDAPSPTTTTTVPATAPPVPPPGPTAPAPAIPLPPITLPPPTVPPPVTGVVDEVVDDLTDTTDEVLDPLLGG